MRLKTIKKVTIEQARGFEDEQGLKGIRKLGIFSQEDSHWILEVDEPTIKNGFRANVKWFQVQEYESDGETFDMPVLMFAENFRLTKEELAMMFNAVGISIIVGEDDFNDSFDEIVLNGVLYHIGVIRKIFGYGVEDFEVVGDSVPRRRIIK